MAVIAVSPVRTAGTAGHTQGFAPEIVHAKPEPVEIGGVAQQRLPPFRRQLDEHRLEQPLALEATRAQFLHHAFEQHALVGYVLIDDSDAVGVDRDDERIAKLPEWHQRLHRFSGSRFPTFHLELEREQEPMPSRRESTGSGMTPLNTFGMDWATGIGSR